MIEDLLAALAALSANGSVSPATLILACLVLALGYALKSVYGKKEQQNDQHLAQMLEATAVMTKLVEQLRNFSERQQEILNKVSTTGMNAARNQETLTRIETMLELDSRRR